MARRSLADRTRLVARASGPAATDAGILAIGLLGLAGGAWADMLPLAVVGAAVVGWSFRPEHERSYLEGFADGLKFTEDEPVEPAGSGEHRAQLRGLPDGPPVALDPGADGPRRPAGGAPAGPGPEPDLRSAFGLPELEPRQPRHALGADGQPVLAAGGPTRSGFPVIRPATEAVSPISIGAVRPAHRRRARSIRPGQ